MYKISFLRAAAEFYYKTSPSIKKKIDKCISILKNNPYRHPNIKRLTHELKDFWRFRIGNYRVVYNIEEHDKLVVIIQIEHRSKIYK